MEPENEKLAAVQRSELSTSGRLPEVDLVNLRLLSQERKPIIVSHAYISFHMPLQARSAFGETVAVNLPEFVGGDGGNAHTVLEHEFGEALAGEKDDFVLQVLHVFKFILAE